MIRTVRTLATLTAALSVAAVAAAQMPRVTDGTLTPRPVGASLATTFTGLVAAQTGPGWIGYSVPVVDGDRRMCCGDWNNGAPYGDCRIEPAAEAPQVPSGTARPADTVAHLEAPESMLVLFRVENHQVERIRTVSADCALDAAGRTIQWLDAVRPADSLALLETFVTSGADARSRVVDGAVAAIALHKEAAADAALARFVAPGRPEGLRKKVTFWLGSARGSAGLDQLQRMLRDDPSVDVRKGAVFGVSQSREPRAFDLLASLARTAAEPRIRGEALFWIAQKQDARAAGVIQGALASDAAPEVRKRAVFALSQLEGDAGTKALLEVARTHADAATRGAAIFWLGQKAGRNAADAINERIAQDPDTEVKKKAVFALSQLPPDQGVPLLIQVAKTNTNPSVRKQAMFWLGQSKDRRAVDFFAEVLTAR